MPSPIVLISIFRETIIGGIAVHSSNLYERIVEEGLPVEKVNYAPVFVAKGVVRKMRLLAGIGWQLLRLRLGGAKVFHFHASNRALVFYLFSLFITISGGKIILSLHSGYGFDRWLSENGKYDRLNKFFFRLLDRLIFMNPDESESIRQRYPFLLGKVVTINPFIAPPAVAIPDFKAIERTPNHFRIATIGVWMQRYNVEEAVAAAVRFQQETGVSTTLTILMSTVIVEADYRVKLKGIMSIAHENIGIELLEDRNDILEILARNDVFIRASFLDSYGLCVAESLLVGTPAIATDVCRRCANALLYRQGDADGLHAHLLAVWKQYKRPRKVLLEDSEDSFNGYREVYRMLG